MTNRSKEKRDIDKAITLYAMDHAAVLSQDSSAGVEKLTDWIVDRVRGKTKLEKADNG